MKKMDSKLNNKGMATIESCILIPLVFAVSILGFFTAVYFYDVNVVSNALMSATLIAESNGDLPDNELLDEALRRYKKRIDGKLVFMESPEIHLELSYFSLEASSSVDFAIDSLVPFFNLNNEGFSITFVQSSPRIRRKFTLRQAGLRVNDI